MQELDDVVRFGTEGTTLDFKAGQYPKEKHEELLRDVLSMANAHEAGDRRIVCGVKLHPDGSRTVHGIDRAAVVDPAIYQQLVHENIEPDLAVDYQPFEVDGQVVAVLSLSGSTARPYAMRKQFGGLAHGHMWIRKGTTKMPIRRADLERIYAARQAAVGPLHLGFDADGQPTALALPAAGEFVLRSHRARREIEGLLAARRTPAPNGIVNPFAFDSFGLTFRDGFVNQPYRSRSTEELKRNLATVEETYRDDDEYEFWTRYGHRLNLAIHLGGTTTLDDVHVEVELPKTPGVAVAAGEPRAPVRGMQAVLGAAHTYEYFRNVGYPSVEAELDAVRVTHTIRAVRHQTTHLAFDSALWIVLGPAAVGLDVPLTCTVRARNLPDPHRATLTLRVAEPDGSLPHAPEEDDE